MKFLCLAYGDEKEWKALPKSRQDGLLAQDDAIRNRGDVVAPVGGATTVRAPNGTLTVSGGPFGQTKLPMAGFYLIEAKELNEAVRLVSNTPCARAGGAIEVWSIGDRNP